MPPPGVLRLGVDAAVAADARLVADAVALAAESLGRPALRVSAEDFLRPRSVRWEHGRDDAETGYASWYDTAALRREVADPLAAGGSGEWLPSLWDAGRDRATRAPRLPAPPGAVLVLEGPFLLRSELAGALDVVVHLSTSPAAISRRLPPEDAPRVLGAWARYLAEDGPAARADVLVRADDPRRPAIAG